MVANSDSCVQTTKQRLLYSIKHKLCVCLKFVDDVRRANLRSFNAAEAAIPFAFVRYAIIILTLEWLDFTMMCRRTWKTACFRL